jgi:hemoglobin-like flavoprotein
MGNKTSSNKTSNMTPRELHMKSIIPGYYIENCQPSENDISVAKTAWDKIMAGENTKPFVIMKENDSTFEYSSSLTWFYDVFYSRFFELCPQAKPFFANTSMLAQGRLIAGVISSSLMALKEPEQLRNRLTHMTVKHNGTGITAVKYGIMGYALLDALERVIGPEDFDAQSKQAWIHIYTFMLNIILPIVVDHEMKDQEQRYGMRNDSVFHKISQIFFANNINSVLQDQIDILTESEKIVHETIKLK